MAKHPHPSFAGLAVQVTNPNWDGTPTTLQVNDSVMIPNAPNGPAVLGWQNVGQQTSDGSLSLASGGGQPTNLDSPVANFPSIMVSNWSNQNISIVNTSPNPQTPIWVELYGPGLGPTPTPLVVGTSLSLPQGTGNTAQGTGPSTWFRITLAATPGNKSVVAISGATDTNFYVYGLAWDTNTPPTGYTKVTTNNTLVLGSYPGNSQRIFITNMSSGNAGPVTVLVQGLS